MNMGAKDMNNCIEYLELISAYADGYLSESDVRRVDEHLEECVNCSALLKITREISVSVSESNVPAPDALRIGVMNRVRSESFFHAPVKVKERKRYQVMFTRYAPIAACLVVGLLVWQTWGYLWGTSENAAFPAPGAVPMYDAAASTSSADAPAAAPEAVMGVMDEEADDDSELNRIIPAPEAAGGSDDDLIAEEAEIASMDVLNDLMIRGDTRSERESEFIFDYIGNAFAQITVTGELPVMLDDYIPQPFGPWLDWEMVFQIPSEMVPDLLAELGNRDGVEVSYTDNNSTYAVVMYSPG